MFQAAYCGSGKKSGNNIGWCGYHLWYTEHQRAEIGYVMEDNNFRGKGLMTEAMRLIISYGFKEMNLNRIEALIEPNNTPSLKLAENFQFVKEGHMRDHYIKNGIAEDSLIYALLKKDYKT